MHTSVISDVKNNYLRYLLCFFIEFDYYKHCVYNVFFIIIICFVNLVSVILCLMYK